ncbi:MAG TPA: ATP-binding protein [Bacteroidales bacterium]|nr:putative DNA binding domain-containing protein [Bacteroidales bacterium]HOR83046.1 ATP-binding protein [Bacteroidales bacterium]
MDKKITMENERVEKKSIRIITGKQPAWDELAKDCVCFANARGGKIYIGIEDDDEIPPNNQIINNDFVNQVRKRISELTINVSVIVSKKTANNGGEYIEVEIQPSQSSVASTTDGRYYIRISDACKPVMPDELNRLFTDKPAFIWETKVVQKITIEQCDQQKLLQFISDIKNSKRVSDFVKQKSKEEILSYYQMYDGNYLTNLGILWIGTNQQRAKLSYAPIVQFIKYDQNGYKIKKELWDDFSLNPKELIQSIWERIPEWREGIEISEGIFGRKIINNYNENVVRELLANALVHRPYTTRGDIFINLYPDKLEIHNPGLLPLGVTPANILHQSVRRNEHLSKIFYDLNLMEREGSGYDKIFEILVSEAKQLPIVEEKNDRVVVIIFNKIKNVETIQLIEKIKQTYKLNQKEIICLGIIAQSKSIIATEFAKQIQSQDDKQIKNWLGNLLRYKIVQTKGKTKGMQYYINPSILKGTSFEKTDLSNIQEHRLKILILEDIDKYPNSSLVDIHKRIGEEIPIRKIRKCLYDAVKNGEIKTIGGKKFRKYFIDKKVG